MGKIELKVGTRFQQAWKLVQKPMWFEVLKIDRTNNSIEVECHAPDGFSTFPETWSLDSTEMGFEIGDYKLL